MLKILHTADWHLGQLFFGYDRDVEHVAFLEWLLGYIKCEQPNTILVAGDVFDTVNPSALATRRYYEFLAEARTAAPDMQVVIIAGNHDAGARLEAPQDLLSALKIDVIGTVQRDAKGDIDIERFLIPLKNTNDDVEALVLAIPFLRPSDVPIISEEFDPYLGGIRELYRIVTDRACQIRDTQFPGASIIAMGHLHLLGGDECKDSERRLVIGGVEALNPDSFSEQLAYVALGHLHKAQNFRGGIVRYSGSPIPLSFAEMNYQHQIVQLEVARNEPLKITPVLVPQSKRLMCVPEKGFEPIESVLQQLADLNLDQDVSEDRFPFLEVRVLEDKPDPTRRRKIEQALEGKAIRLASIKVEYPTRDSSPIGDEIETMVDLRSLDPETIFLAAYKEKYAGPPEDAVLAAFREILLELSRNE